MKEIDEYFKHYRDLKSRIREKKYELEELEKNMYYVNAVSFSDIPKTTHSTNDKLACMIHDKDELIGQIRELEKDKKVLENNHIKDIYRIDNEKYRTVLRSYFINDLSIERISVLLKVSAKHVYKLKAKAEESLYEMILNDTN